MLSYSSLCLIKKANGGFRKEVSRPSVEFAIRGIIKRSLRREQWQYQSVCNEFGGLNLFSPVQHQPGEASSYPAYSKLAVQDLNWRNHFRASPASTYPVLKRFFLTTIRVDDPWYRPFFAFFCVLF
jgi:hypothetical protein